MRRNVGSEIASVGNDAVAHESGNARDVSQRQAVPVGLEEDLQAVAAATKLSP